MKIVFLGTPEIAVPSLEFFINKEDIELSAVVTQPDKPAGRGQKLTSPPVKILAEKQGIKVYQPDSIRKDQDLINILKELKPDLFITIAFGQILSQEILDIPKLGTVNMHASLLPKYRGANPIQQAIINGDKVTGITTMLTDIGIDTGAILLKKEINITENMDAIELAEVISKEAGPLLYKTIIGLKNKTITPVPQNHQESTHAPKLKKEDGKINWNVSAHTIHNKVRGMLPWPSCYTTFKDAPVKILKTEILKNKENMNMQGIGEIIGIINNGIGVITGNGIIIVKTLQPSGKKAMDATIWYHGARIQKDDKFK
ncbi:MAG: methionyl-tRNA formyltransferase [Candidatus Gastranaerophilales bacterium]|nr:methionyl-tRNA formyltransferase [Candidatus Gastranaerophilales bacterium]